MDTNALFFVVLVSSGTVLLGSAVLSLTYGGKVIAEYGDKSSTMVADLRDRQISRVLESLIDYIMREKNANPEARVDDILSYAFPVRQLRLLEDINDKRAQLRKLENDISEVTIVSRIASILLVATFLLLFPLCVPLALNLAFAGVAWYASWSATTGVFGLLAMSTFLLLHSRVLASKAHFSKMQAAEILEL